MFLKENYCNHILQLMSFRWHKVLSFFQYFDSSTIHQINLKTQLYSHDIEQEYVNHPKRNFSKTFFKVIDLNPSPPPPPQLCVSLRLENIFMKELFWKAFWIGHLKKVICVAQWTENILFVSTQPEKNLSYVFKFILISLDGHYLKKNNHWKIDSASFFKIVDLFT